MSIIDQLIQIKKSSDSNDIVNMLDEFTLYGRLSKIPALSDISKSKALQKQLPLLSRAVDKDIYCLSLYMVANSIVAYLGYEIPVAISSHVDSIPESLKQKLIIAQENTIRVDYQSLDMYQHAVMEEAVKAIYINNLEDETRIVIVTRIDKNQRIFQGSYIAQDEEESDDTDSKAHQKAKTLSYVDEKLAIKINNYSIQGNNAYLFAKVKLNKVEYDMMIDDAKGLILKIVKGKGQDFTIQLDIVAMNRINMAKSNPQTFIDTLAQIINEAV